MKISQLQYGIGVFFVVFGFLAILGIYNPSFDLVAGAVYFAWAYISFVNAKEIEKVENR